MKDNFLTLIIFIPMILSISIGRYLKKRIEPNLHNLLKKISLVITVITILYALFILYYKPVPHSEYGWNTENNTLHKYSTGKFQNIAVIDRDISASNSSILSPQVLKEDGTLKYKKETIKATDINFSNGVGSLYKRDIDM
ncbi:hypothetical protein [Ruminiclostridium josui]|uniref:hypothetical protein n=1 Tax=Ruminiclostridium josui TaxID=1499 RepID=UPI000464B90F|nr:hypothetical protein [Ruminiclostridium josui]